MGARRMVRLQVNGVEIEAPEGTTVAAVVARHGVRSFRRSVEGMPRGPLCGMGVCFECRVTIDGNPGIRSCMAVVSEGAEVHTDA